jgi:hypothetical protein
VFSGAMFLGFDSNSLSQDKETATKSAYAKTILLINNC